MSAQSEGRSFRAAAAMMASIGLTLVFVIIIMRNLLPSRDEPHAPRAAGTNPTEPMTAGVRAELTAGGVSIARSLPSLSFSLNPGQTLDARLPPGPMNAVLTVRFEPGMVRSARIGADVLGGEVVVRRAGRIIASDASTSDPVRVLSPPMSPIPLNQSAETIEYEIAWNGKRPFALRGVWQPQEPVMSRSVLLLPSAGAPLLDEAALRGELLANELNCAACHRSANASLQAKLISSAAPSLTGLAHRTSPAWFRQWIMSPHALKPGTRMPNVFHRLREGDLDAVVSLRYEAQEGDHSVGAGSDESLITTGRVFYHSVGCIACHGPLESLEELPGGLTTRLEPWRTYEPLGPLAMKTNVEALAEFLEHPLDSRPSGRMPSLELTDLEARSIASYLIRQTGGMGDGARAVRSATGDAARIEVGRKVFTDAGCANCHSYDSMSSEIPVLSQLPPLESLASSLEAGCLAANPGAGVPHFAIHEFDRDALRAFLRSLDSRRSEDVPLDALALEMNRLNCLACHEFGAWRGPEAAIAAYFGAADEADLGDEGRLPPSLTDAGARLTTAWMHTILSEETRARPYLNVRMPCFGEANTSHLPELIASVSGVAAVPRKEPEFNQMLAAAGRRLVGSDGLNCIQCHSVAGHPSTGAPGPDLAIMTGRVNCEFFDRWLSDPSFIAPGTRMPSFFAGIVSPIGDVFEGDPDRQIDAIWAYLSQGDSLPLPEGLPDPTGLELVVQDEPIVFRTFMKDAGIRAIACGFPEQIHCAFDADRCELALIWQNHFLSAAGAWASRGGSETNPDTVVWRALQQPVLSFADAADAMEQRRFLGYTLDERRRPIFQYELSRGEESLLVREQPLPDVRNGQRGMTRHFELEGSPGRSFVLHSSAEHVKGVNVDRLDAEHVIIRLDDKGLIAFSVEVAW